MHYVDAPGMDGDYILFLKVERTDNLPDCAANLTSVFNGSAVMTLTIPGQKPRTFTEPISLPVEFTDCRRSIRITNFPAITTVQYQTPLGPNTTTVTQSGGGTGSITQANGDLRIPITLGFVHTYRALGNSTLTLNLTGTESENFTLDGSGTFSGGYLGTVGSTATVRITGSFSPRPR